MVVDGDTALDRAMMSRDLEIIRQLVTLGADAKPEVHDYAPLHWAVSRNDAEIAAYLLAKGADPNARNSKGQIPLQIAEERLAEGRGNREVVRLLTKASR